MKQNIHKTKYKFHFDINDTGIMSVLRGNPHSGYHNDFYDNSIIDSWWDDNVLLHYGPYARLTVYVSLINPPTLETTCFYSYVIFMIYMWDKGIESVRLQYPERQMIFNEEFALTED